MASTTDKSREIVQSIYDNAASGNFEAIVRVLDENIIVTPPPYWPWAGPYTNREDWLAKCLPMIGTVYDMSSLTCTKLIAEGDEVVASLKGRVLESGEEIEGLEIWKIRDGKAIEMKVFAFDPRPVDRQLAKVALKAREA